MKTAIFAVLLVSLWLFPCPLKAEVQLRQWIARDLSTPQPSASRLIATDREVAEFLDSYIERYTKKDIDGFLWLFSLKAVQNQKDRLPGIREIYRNFFDRTQTLHCRFEERRVEIYDNAVEIKARYEVERITKESGDRKFLRGSIRWVLIKEDGILKIRSLDYKPQKSP